MKKLWIPILVTLIALMQVTFLVLRLMGYIPTTSWGMPIFHVVFCTLIATYVWVVWLRTRR